MISRREVAVYRAGVLDRAEVAMVRGLAEGLPAEKGTVRNKVVDTGIRAATVRWIKPTEHPDMAWLFARVGAAMKELNERYFGFDVDWDRTIKYQFTEYRPGDFYGPHADMPMDTEATVERKFSCTVQLSDPGQYGGGELVVENKRLCPGKQIAPGTLIAFPSYARHEVLPVTWGTRHSLVAWYMGHRWR